MNTVKSLLTLSDVYGDGVTSMSDLHGLFLLGDTVSRFPFAIMCLVKKVFGRDCTAMIGATFAQWILSARQSNLSQ